MNLPRLYERLRADGLDAIIATAPENVTYSSGYWAMSQWIRRGPQAYVLIPAERHGEPCIVADTSAVDLIADQKVWVQDVRPYGPFVIDRSSGVELDQRSAMFARLLDRQDRVDAVAVLVRAIRERGLEGARIGVDELGTTPQHWDRLLDLLPTTTFVRAAAAFRYVRAVKTPEEVARLRTSARIAEKSILAALAIAREGVTECDLGRVFHKTTIEEGGMPVLGCIGFGPRSAMPNVQPSETKLKRGDIIRFDVGGRYQHYRADIARIGVFGEPSPKIARYHRAICAGLGRAYEMIRPGVRVADVFEAVVETVRREGLPHYRRSHIGHGIGLDGYDAPSIAPNSAEVFEESMVVCVETPYYEIGFGGLQVEDTLVVTKDGIESFMTTSTDLMVV